MSTKNQQLDAVRGAEALRPRVGALVRDESRGRVGVLMAVGAYCDPSGPPSLHRVTPPASAPLLAYLRPQGGGREWTVPPEAVTVLSADDALREKLRGSNGRSTGPEHERLG